MLRIGMFLRAARKLHLSGTRDVAQDSTGYRGYHRGNVTLSVSVRPATDAHSRGGDGGGGDGGSDGDGAGTGHDGTMENLVSSKALDSGDWLS